MTFSLTRRSVLAAAVFAAGPPVLADENVRRVHAIALVGEPELPDDYKNFPWVNPDAPKGGEVALTTVGTFDSFNPFVVRGTAAGLGGVFETLTMANPDEAAASYGRLAQIIELPADKSWVAFDLRAEAKWWDGKPIAADDVAWAFNTLREQGRPLYARYLG